MTGKVRRAALDTKSARLKLPAGEPQYFRLREALHLGYLRDTRKGSAGLWVVRRRDSDGKSVVETVGTADDLQDADGAKILTFDQAQEAARDHAKKAVEQQRRAKAGPPTNLFGFARGELPGEADVWFWERGGPEAVAREIIAQWKKWAARHKIGSRRLDGGQLTELAAIAGMLTGYYSRLRLAPPQIVAEAIMTILGLVGENKTPSSLPKIMRQMKIPVVDDIEKFRRAALLDGEADAISLGLTAGFSTPFDSAPPTLASWLKREREPEPWMKLRRKPDGDLASPSEWECEELATIEWSSKSELSANYLAAEVGVERATIRSWRKMDAYIKRRQYVREAFRIRATIAARTESKIQAPKDQLPS